jgi:hypothetical protein
MVMPVSSVPTPRRASRRTSAGLTSRWNLHVDNHLPSTTRRNGLPTLSDLKPVVIARPWLPS